MVKVLNQDFSANVRNLLFNNALILYFVYYENMKKGSHQKVRPLFYTRRRDSITPAQNIFHRYKMLHPASSLVFRRVLGQECYLPPSKGQALLHCQRRKILPQPA